MPELLNLDTPDWTLVVWCKDISHSQRQFAHTLRSRQKNIPATCLRFAPVLHITDCDSFESEYQSHDTPVFFENKLYEFDFQFRRCSGEPVIKHRLQTVEDAFHYSRNSLRGGINFGNDVGWFKLELQYHNGEKQHRQALSFEVFPTKMDIESDISAIQQDIDKHYPLLRFSFAQKTEQELARSRKPHERFPLLWLSQFESLRLELEKGIKQILQNPHSRLLPHERKYRADQLKGRLSARLEESVATAFAHQDIHKKYQLNTKELSVDTPENRFIKMVLNRCTREISLFVNQARKNNSPPENARLSESFFEKLDVWKKPLEQSLKRPFFREVGEFDGLNSESLVLHHKEGYARVYRVWQQLKLYLDVFGQQAGISMKSIAELYEVWCVLELRRILLDDLGFTESSSQKALLYKKGMEKQLHEGFKAAFHLQRDNVKIRLAHEPVFRHSEQPQAGNIYSWITSQKPDILLEVELGNSEKIRWIFDAKYRISLDDSAIDYAPDDAINQMHRYRDALIHIHRANDGWQEKSRPVFGAFVLYPGWFDEDTSENPYQSAIEAVGIGAFPLLPDSKNTWLRDFLIEQLGNSSKPYPTENPDYYFVQEAARISHTGMTLSKYQDLTLTTALGSRRTKNYLEKFQQGKAEWYHIPLQSTLRNNMQRAAIREIKYCAFVVYYPDDRQRRIDFIYEVRSVRLVKRKEITNEQAGAKAKSENLEKEYWLFELGKARPLDSAIDVSGTRDFKLRLASAEQLSKAENWQDLSNHYSFLQNM
jgi:hypothetical protein